MIGLVEVAEHFNVSRRTILNWIERREFPGPIRVGRQLRWRVDELNEWIEAGCPAIIEGNRA
jgi:excisionase family DNA binding protein